jgi:hypothetical protein
LVELKLLPYNGGVCTVREKNAIYSGQIKALTAKLTRLKYRLPVGLPRRRYSIFLVFTVYVMGPQFNISSEFFFFFCDVWIELSELHKIKYVSNLKKIFYESQSFGSTARIFESNDIIDSNFKFCKKSFLNSKHTFSYETR